MNTTTPSSPAPPDIVVMIFLLIVLALVIIVFVTICIRLRQGGGSMTTVVLGATDAFLTQDRRKAAETIVNENAGRRFTGQASADPEVPGEAKADGMR